MRATPSFLATISLLTGLSAQSIADHVPRWPGHLETRRFSPFTDSKGVAQARKVDQVGSFDVDGDNNEDLWFLDATGNLQVSAAHTADLGRFRPFASRSKTPYVAAATYRSKSLSRDVILGLDPSKPYPDAIRWVSNSPRLDPRIGRLSSPPSYWNTGINGREIDTADHDGDGHDDIAVLVDLPSGGCRLRKIVMGTSKYGFLWEEDKVDIQLPIRVQKMRMLDFDADGRSDLVVWYPGLGVGVLADLGWGSFHWVDFLPTGQVSIRDITVGDTDGDGTDDVLLVLDEGVVVIHGSKNLQSLPWSRHYSAFRRSQAIAPLRSCAVFPGAGNKALILTIPSDRKALEIHAMDPQSYQNTPSVILPSGYTGSGSHGDVLACTLDMDNDGDLDLSIQHPDGSHWLGLRNPTFSLAPLGFQATDRGAAPKSEGAGSRVIEVRVQVPRELVDNSVPHLEVAFYAADPASPNPKDPRYIYWGRLTPLIDPATASATFYTFHDDNDKSWDTRLLNFDKRRKLSLTTKHIVYPDNEAGTIRAGNRMFFQMHGLASARRHEGMQGKSPDKSGSSFAGRWILISRPPSPTADLELLPWE